MREENEFSWVAESMSDDEKSRFGNEVSIGLARRRHDDFDSVVDSHKWKGKQLDEINAAPDPGERAYEIAKEKITFKETPMEKMLQGEKTFRGR